MTRYSLVRPSGMEGHASVIGRNAVRAAHAVLCDALYQENAAHMVPVLSEIEKCLTDVPNLLGKLKKFLVTAIGSQFHG